RCRERAGSGRLRGGSAAGAIDGAAAREDRRRSVEEDRGTAWPKSGPRAGRQHRFGKRRRYSLDWVSNAGDSAGAVAAGSSHAWVEDAGRLVAGRDDELPRVPHAVARAGREDGSSSRIHADTHAAKVVWPGGAAVESQVRR